MPKFAASKYFSERLKGAMVHRGVNGDLLAKATGLTASYISTLRTGKRKNPSPDAAKKLADALGVSHAWLLTGEGNTPAFDDHLKMLEDVRDYAEAAGESPREKQIAVDAALDMSQMWRGRAEHAERRLDAIALALYQLAESIGPRNEILHTPHHGTRTKHKP